MICPLDGTEKSCLDCNKARLHRCTLDAEQRERLQHKEYNAEDKNNQRLGISQP